MNVVTDLIPAIQPYLSPALMGPSHILQMRAVTDHLPFALTSLLGFECRLGNSDGHVDLFVHVAGPGRDVLARHRSVHMPAFFFADPNWCKLSDLCSNWCDPASPLAQKLFAISLEFDLPLPKCTVPTPFVFLTTTDVGLLTPGGDLRWCLDYALPILFGNTLAPDLRTLLTDCICALPPGTGICDVGLAINRSPAIVRLNGGMFQLREIVPYLHRVRWPGTRVDYVQLERLIEGLESVVDVVKSCLDLTDRVGPRLGLEFSVSAEQAPSRYGWSAVLSFLGRRGLCKPGMERAVLSYIGTSTARDSLGYWPEALESGSRILGQRYTSVIVRNISHIKISLVPGRGEEAKAYLFAGYAWRRNVLSGRSSFPMPGSPA